MAVKILSVNDTIGLVHFSGLLSPEECTELIAAGESSNAKPSEVIYDVSDVSYETSGRRSTVASPSVDRYPIIKAVRRRISLFIGVAEENQEPLQVLHYTRGGKYDIHYDSFLEGSPQLENGGNRMLTVLLYLNDVEQGGWTQFPHIMANIVPSVGTGILFRNIDAQNLQLRESLHAGLPVIDGEKWIASIWIREKAYVAALPADRKDEISRRTL
ncbi:MULTISPECIES: prolyl hydroxylase family protein [Acidithiobacillus]|jgi:2OG-Fe(II) oxygenase superfamily.|uniref:Oxidoreductase n=5 Tax=Acidithiobacillus TaxID=119977 RepID=A0A179BKJ6_ACIFR|nr:MULTISPECIES: 2OG-Fe(II) oxygenase [Acidithiobacillus]MBU2784266.1 2OG-Fe(II) oxygenase [Acidithiobacillus ferriphilus]MBU2827801.1 2OG-Fe(II) oxygenase [Acidithiobacillus ferriphilus]MBU2831206.1 2OG-Fe(II) oxygenase [Acidithiobacillus ferriphilus]MBU2834080.1 2OG-Fe(II) oxygenase [Acidithiobacillus ferriphilus]MBU2846125.1 2OG-Fe(II) oxygenase [Acidithiobacillus ferriphilus]